MSIPGFLNLGIIKVWGRRIFCMDDCPVHWRIISSIPGLYPLDSNSRPSLGCENQSSLCSAKWGKGGGHASPSWKLLVYVLLASTSNLKFIASDFIFYSCAAVLLVHKLLFGNQRTKQNRKPVHHKIINRIGRQSRASVVTSQKKNLHMNNILKQGLNTLSHSLPLNLFTNTYLKMYLKSKQLDYIPLDSLQPLNLLHHKNYWNEK